jgi:hypothetical protein
MANVDGRCSRKAAASVFRAARDFASESVESNTISEEGIAGRPNRRLTSMVPGGATRQENTEAARSRGKRFRGAREAPGIGDCDEGPHGVDVQRAHVSHSNLLSLK